MDFPRRTEDSTTRFKPIESKPPILQRFAAANAQWSVDWLLVVVVVICIAIAVAGESLRELARYERSDVIDGQYWRLISAHFVHLGWSHLWLNVGALLILGALLRDVLSRRDLLASAFASIAIIDLGFLALEPDLEWYVGLSGLLHGLMATGVVCLVLQRDLLGALLAVGLIGKLTFEQMQGALPLTAQSTGAPVIVDAHLYGAIGGAIVGITLGWLRRNR